MARGRRREGRGLRGITMTKGPHRGPLARDPGAWDRVFGPGSRWRAFRNTPAAPPFASIRLSFTETPVRRAMPCENTRAPGSYYGDLEIPRGGAILILLRLRSSASNYKRLRSISAASADQPASAFLFRSWSLRCWRRDRSTLRAVLPETDLQGISFVIKIISSSSFRRTLDAGYYLPSMQLCTLASRKQNLRASNKKHNRRKQQRCSEALIHFRFAFV